MPEQRSVDAIIAKWAGILSASKNEVTSLNCVFDLKILDQTNRRFLIRCTDSPSFEEVSQNYFKSDVEIILTKEDLLSLDSGMRTPQALFLDGKIQLTGDISRALDFSSIFFKQ